MTILMSVDNPDGHKLEELLSRVQHELRDKNSKLMGDCPINAPIRANNLAIISLLETAESLQRNTMNQLETLESQGLVVSLESDQTD
jgi:hypothetical protein